MTTLVYDGSFEGWLSAVFIIYEYKLHDVSIIPETHRQESLFGNTKTIATDEEKANRVWNGLKKRLSEDAAVDFYKSFLSEIIGIEDKFLLFVQYAFSAVEKIEKDFSHPAVLFVAETARKVHREKHRMEAFVRFQQTQDAMYYAIIEPDFNVLPLIKDHFQKRYADQPWMIYDAKRKYGLYYDGEEVTTVTINFNEQPGANGSIATILDEKEALYQDLWQHYFNSVNIASRKNVKLHIRHVPLRY